MAQANPPTPFSSVPGEKAGGTHQQQEQGWMQAGSRDGCRQAPGRDAGSISMATQQKGSMAAAPREERGQEKLCCWRGHRDTSPPASGRSRGSHPRLQQPTPAAQGCNGDPARRSSQWGPSSFSSAGELWLIAMQIAKAVPCP